MEDAGERSTGTFTLYTNKGCPFAHRVHIVLRELGLDYEEVEIDLEKSREPWYLEVNPSGLVPALRHTHPSFPGTSSIILVESTLIIQYLIDAFPTRFGCLTPANKDLVSAYMQYTIRSLIETWWNRVHPCWSDAFLMLGTSEGEEKAEKLFDAIQTYIEPRLVKVTGRVGQGAFVGGAQNLTLFEVSTAPFVLRIYEFSNDLIFPVSLGAKLESLPAYSKWSKAVISQESVLYAWDKEYNIEISVRVAPGMRKKFRVPGYE